MDRHDTDARLAILASGQHGLVSRAQALASGASDGALRQRVSSGRWVRVAPGVYRIAGVPVTWHQRALAAVLVAGPGAVVSHHAAAVLFGLDGFRPGRLHLTVPSPRGGRNALATVHRSRTLAPTDVSIVERIPTTAPGRLLVDLAGAVSPDRLERAVDDVLVRRLSTLDAVTARLKATGRFSGRTALAGVLAAWQPGPLPASVAEMRLVRCLLAAGLPQPVRQYQIRAQGRFVARVDVAYPWARLAIELDSFRWHAGRGAFDHDRTRRNRIEAAGWRVLHATPADLDDHARHVVAATRALLAAAA